MSGASAGSYYNILHSVIRACCGCAFWSRVIGRDEVCRVSARQTRIKRVQQVNQRMHQHELRRCIRASRGCLIPIYPTAQDALVNLALFAESDRSPNTNAQIWQFLFYSQTQMWSKIGLHTDYASHSGVWLSRYLFSFPRAYYKLLSTYIYINLHISFSYLPFGVI